MMHLRLDQPRGSRRRHGTVALLTRTACLLPFGMIDRRGNPFFLLFPRHLPSLDVMWRQPFFFFSWMDASRHRLFGRSDYFLSPGAMIVQRRRNLEFSLLLKKGDWEIFFFHPH
jgi:hypothetical protein